MNSESKVLLINTEGATDPANYQPLGQEQKDATETRDVDVEVGGFPPPFGVVEKSKPRGSLEGRCRLRCSWLRFALFSLERFF